MKVAIVKYNAGNICSVINALKRVGVAPIVTDNPSDLLAADKILFPGQGEARNTMTYLRERKLDKLICDLKQPVLGICIGQQLMCRHSQEGDIDCLGIFDADVQKFKPEKHEFKVPHMGWNTLTQISSPLFKGIKEEAFVYFVHSFHVPICSHTVATTEYIVPFSAALQKDNFYATQFHPEKSGEIGEQIIKNFLDL